MSTKPNDHCPCGSGKKFKRCCKYKPPEPKSPLGCSKCSKCSKCGAQIIRKCRSGGQSRKMLSNGTVIATTHHYTLQCEKGHYTKKETKREIKPDSN